MSERRERAERVATELIDHKVPWGPEGIELSGLFDWPTLVAIVAAVLDALGDDTAHDHTLHDPSITCRCGRSIYLHPDPTQATVERVEALLENPSGEREWHNQGRSGVVEVIDVDDLAAALDPETGQ